MRSKVLVTFSFLVLGCRSPQGIQTAHQPSPDLVTESFDDAAVTARSWTAELPKIAGAKVQIEQLDDNKFMSLLLPENPEIHELTVRRTIDLWSVRGKRVRLTARIRTPKPIGGSAHVRLSVSRLSVQEAYSDSVDSRSVSSDSWTTVYAVVDVDPGAAQGDIALTLSGFGVAWFDDVDVTVLGPSLAANGAQLSASMNERLATLARVLALVRYFHPADQSATTDWNAFSVHAIETLLKMSGQHSMQDILEQLFAGIAPTVRFTSSTDSAPPSFQREPRATRLVRWHHIGLGEAIRDSLYLSFRAGIESEESAYTTASIEVKIPSPANCSTVEIHGDIRNSMGEAWIVATSFRPGNRRGDIRQPIPAQRVPQVVIARGDVPSDVQSIRLKLYLVARASVELAGMTLRCGNTEVVRLDAHSAWELGASPGLYRKEITSCGKATCLLVHRLPPDTAFVRDRDVAEVNIGNGLRVLLPLAVWSDGVVTFPQGAALELPPPRTALPDLPVRLAAVVAAWGTLSWFYPYFSDQGIDWHVALPGALNEAAAATSGEETHAALSRLVAALQDGHGRVRHPTRSATGMLPVALRKFGDKFIVVGGLPEYSSSVPVGSEVVALDGARVEEKYAARYPLVAAATEQFRDYLATLYLLIGRIGSFKHVKLRSPHGDALDVVLPLVSRQQFDRDIRIHHPKTGAEVAASIFYVDPMTLERASLPALIQSLTKAQAIILDLRGYVKNEVFEFLAHFLSSPVLSPRLHTPVVSLASSRQYEDESWHIWPATPRLRCPLIVLTDTRAVSAAETVLQIIRDNRLGTFVGEPSAGTNGSVNTFTVPGGFEIRFTGMRVSAPDDSTIQGKGIIPDRVVHPTLEGIRAGRDEILEAGIAVAQSKAP